MARERIGSEQPAVMATSNCQPQLFLNLFLALFSPHHLCRMWARRALTVRNISAKCFRCLSSNLATSHLAGPCKPAASHVLPAQAPSSSSLQSTNGSRAHPNHDFPHNNLVLSNAQRRTIYALSTPPGKGGVAVIRISGPNALQVWHRMVRTRSRARRTDPHKGHPTEERASSRTDPKTSLPIPWKLERCHIIDSESGELLDDGLVVFFRGRWLNMLCFLISRTNVHLNYSFYRPQVFHYRRRP